MAREIMDFPIITGGPGEPTIKDFLKYTTTSLKKIVLEEKLFKTWYHGRVVLLGNGNVLCHFISTRSTSLRLSLDIYYTYLITPTCLPIRSLVSSACHKVSRKGSWMHFFIFLFPTIRVHVLQIC